MNKSDAVDLFADFFIQFLRQIFFNLFDCASQGFDVEGDFDVKDFDIDGQNSFILKDELIFFGITDALDGVDCL